MKLLLTNPNFDGIVEDPSLSLCFIGTYVKEHSDCEVEIVEPILQQVSREQLLDKVRNSDILGLTCYTESRFQVFDFAKKAKEINPKLPEVYLGLGCYYLLAPKVAGGNIERAIEELQCALQIAPEFCTACARLAQAYKKKGDLDKYNSYFKRAKELDPGNEVVKELENDKSGS